MIACQDKWHPSALAELHIHLRLAAGRAYREVGEGVGVVGRGGAASRSMDGGFSAVDGTAESRPAATLQGPQTVEFHEAKTQPTFC